MPDADALSARQPRYRRQYRRPGRQVRRASARCRPLQRISAQFGPDRWCFEAQGWRLVGLNAQLFGTGTSAEEEQFAWVAGRLTNGKPVALFLHKPLFRNSPADDEVHIRYVPVAPRRRLLDLFARQRPASRRLGPRASAPPNSARRGRACLVAVDGLQIPDALQEAVGRKLVGAASLELSEQ